jgi:hypothetical protein
LLSAFFWFLSAYRAVRQLSLVIGVTFPAIRASAGYEDGFSANLQALIPPDLAGFDSMMFVGKSGPWSLQRFGELQESLSFLWRRSIRYTKKDLPASISAQTLLFFATLEL